MELIITREILSKVAQFGACDETPKLGKKISKICQVNLIWAENHGLKVDGAVVPLFALADSGSGYGSGYGDGYGSGYGDGYGYGSGYGDGSGDGDGHTKLMEILGLEEI